MKYVLNTSIIAATIAVTSAVPASAGPMCTAVKLVCEILTKA